MSVSGEGVKVVWVEREGKRWDGPVEWVWLENVGGGGGGELNIIGNSHLVRFHVHICVLHVQR